ncbi:unnamed protein product, partial [Phaeothamnion confervicola]
IISPSDSLEGLLTEAGMRAQEARVRQLGEVYSREEAALRANDHMRDVDAAEHDALALLAVLHDPRGRGGDDIKEGGDGSDGDGIGGGGGDGADDNADTVAKLGAEEALNELLRDANSYFADGGGDEVSPPDCRRKKKPVPLTPLRNSKPAGGGVGAAAASRQSGIHEGPLGAAPGSAAASLARMAAKRGSFATERKSRRLVGADDSGGGGGGGGGSRPGSRRGRSEVPSPEWQGKAQHASPSPVRAVDELQGAVRRLQREIDALRESAETVAARSEGQNHGGSVGGGGGGSGGSGGERERSLSPPP